MVKLNPTQFGEQLSLFKAPAPTKQAPPAQGPPEPKKWSGPIKGQYAMGPHLEDALVETEHGPVEGHMHADEHGNFNEEKILGGWDPSASLESVYEKHTRQMLMVGATSRPTQQMRTDHPLHTLQPVTETETLYDLAHGPERRKNLEASVAESGVSKPILLVKHQGRHIVIDGHHRLLAARKAGHETVPVKVFDHDEHVAKGGLGIIEGSDEDPYGREHSETSPTSSHSEPDLLSGYSGYSHSGDADDREPSGWT